MKTNQIGTSLSAAAACLLIVTGCSQEPGAWQKAITADTADAYESYLEEYPSGTHAAEATQRRAARIEKGELDAALTANTIEALEAFLAKFKDSTARKDVENSLGRLHEARDWADVKTNANVKRLVWFVQTYPESAHKEEATALLERALRWQKALSEGRAVTAISIQCTGENVYMHNASPKGDNIQRNGAVVKVTGTTTITDAGGDTLVVELSGVLWSKDENLWKSYLYSYDTEFGESDLAPFEGCISQPELDRQRPVALFSIASVTEIKTMGRFSGGRLAYVDNLSFSGGIQFVP